MFQFEIQSFAYKDFDSWCLPWDLYFQNGYHLYLKKKKIVWGRKGHSFFFYYSFFYEFFFFTSEGF